MVFFFHVANALAAASIAARVSAWPHIWDGTYDLSGRVDDINRL